MCGKYGDNRLIERKQIVGRAPLAEIHRIQRYIRLMQEPPIILLRLRGDKPDALKIRAQCALQAQFENFIRALVSSLLDSNDAALIRFQNRRE